MGKAGRIVCIFVPMALTVISLIFLVMVGLAQTNAKSNYLSNLYFLRANLTGATANFTSGNSVNNQTVKAAIGPNNHIIISDYYTIGLWNYCASDGKNASVSSLSVDQDTAEVALYCTPRQTHFAFDPKIAWGLTGDFNTRFFSDKLNSALKSYESGFSKAMGPLYIITVVAAGVEVLIGIGAIFSRLGSVFTTVSAMVTTLFSFVLALVATIAYFVLDGALNAALNKEGIHFNTGRTLYIYLWLTFICSFVASLFWSLSSCCCSGKSSRKSRDKEVGGYERMDGGQGGYQMQSPFVGNGANHGGQQGHQTGAYEPYRQQ